MGLDMYAYTAPAALIGEDQVDFGEKIFPNGEALESVNRNFAYWRKFNHLHGWMERLYYAKGGQSNTFNCNVLRLTEDDLDRLESDLKDTLSGKGDKLPATSGFFFGGAEIHPDDIESLENFIERAGEALDDGLAVIYDSWW